VDLNGFRYDNVQLLDTLALDKDLHVFAPDSLVHFELATRSVVEVEDAASHRIVVLHVHLFAEVFLAVSLHALNLLLIVYRVQEESEIGIFAL